MSVICGDTKVANARAAADIMKTAIDPSTLLVAGTDDLDQTR
jgi:hypothetical protein